MSEDQEAIREIGRVMGDVFRKADEERKKRLYSAKVYDKFCVYKETGELCRYLCAPAKQVSGYIFQGVENFRTGERFEPRVDLLRPLSEMEAVAWAAREEDDGRQVRGE